VSETKTETPPTRRVDPELQTMAKLDKLLAELPSDEACERVLDWLASRHGFVLSRVYVEGEK
jgi:hypothetical protein